MHRQIDTYECSFPWAYAMEYCASTIGMYWKMGCGTGSNFYFCGAPTLALN